MLGRAVLTLSTLLLLAACVSNSGPPAPASPAASPSPAGPRCATGDSPISAGQLGWAFCYPKAWHLRERAIGTQAPAGVDTTLDVIADGGLFGFMIIGAYNRGAAADLAAWLAENEPADGPTDPIHWSTATEAVQVRGSLKRYALVANRVYLLDLRQGTDNLQLDTEMGSRLSTWVFG